MAEKTNIPKAQFLAVGDKAPTFTAQDQDGKSISLSDYKGKKVALCFYVNDGTKACDNELLNLQASLKDFEKQSIQVLAVSKNTVEEHSKNAKNLKITFPMLADPDLKIIKSYKVWGEKNMYGNEYEGVNRAAYVIDENDKIIVSLHRVTSTKAAQQILSNYEKLSS